MAHWNRCPQCGETNFYVAVYTQVFDCGFKGSVVSDLREARCNAGGSRHSRPSATAAAAQVVNHEAGPSQYGDGYRLVLLDAAHTAEIIADDMEEASVEDEHVGRVRSLAQQLREYGGHSTGVPTPSSEAAQKGGTALTRWMRKVTG
jgi:hypothetical protein